MNHDGHIKREGTNMLSDLAMLTITLAMGFTVIGLAMLLHKI
jgi:hypothetical protein